MTKLLTIVFISLTLASCTQNKQDVDKDKQRIDSVCEKFMQTFATGKISEAFELLKQNSIISPSSFDTLQATTNNQMKNALLSYGKMLSSEFILERKVNNFITKRFYILKFDKYCKLPLSSAIEIGVTCKNAC